MYQQRNGRQLMMIGGVVIVAALVLFFLFSRSGGSSSNKTITTQKVVIAAQSIPSGTTFQAGQDLSTFFSTAQVPTKLIPLGAYTSVNQINSLVKSAGCQPARTPGCRGQVTVTQTIYQNLPVVSGMFSTLGQYRSTAGPAFQIPYGYVAQALSLSSVNSVLGAINPGDDIDVIASLTGLESNSGIKVKVPTQTQYVMNDVRVISVNGPPGGAANATSNGSNSGGSVVLLLRYQEALILQHLKDFGGSWSLSAVLRSAKETDIPHFRTLPVTERWFFVKQNNHFDFTDPY